MEFMSEKIKPNLFIFVYEDHILGLDKNGRGIYEVNRETGRIILKGLIPNVNDKMPFSGVGVWNNKLLFIPFKNSSVYIYDTNDKNWDTVKIIDDSDTTDGGFFLDSLVKDNHLILFPFNYKFLIDMDLDSKLFVSIDLSNICGDRIGDRLAIKHYCMDDDRVLIPLFATNVIIEYNFKSHETKKIMINDQKFQINSITGDGKKIYLLSRNSLEIVVMNKDMTEERRVQVNDEIRPLGDDITYFDQSGFECSGQYLYCFAARWNRCVRVNLLNYRSEVVENLTKYSDTENDSEKISKFNHGMVLGSKILIQNFNEKIIEFDMNDTRCREFTMKNNDPEGLRLKAFLESIVNG